MTEPTPERDIFVTVDKTKARSSLGQTFLVGGVPYVATTAEVEYGERWVVKGRPKNDWPPRRT